ncbi:uncharacterized protein LOC142629098 [Castanea sativa]|uniref:uncharacterized protein LOC142629098 n=1 Tax=Castanea sativa TaxID=21020 RepID=UPI003F65493B
MFNEIDGDFDEVAINTFKVGLPSEHDLRKSLTKKPLVKEGRLKQLLYRPNGQRDHSGSVNQGKNASRPPLGTINVIFAALGRTGSRPFRVMSVARTFAEKSNFEPKRIKRNVPPTLSFSEEDKIGTIQSHDNALVVTLRIGGYDVKRSSSEVVEVDFIVVDAYSPYTAIVARPWLHALGAVSSTLHLKVKFPCDQIEELVESQSIARQCMAATILHQPRQESSASAEGGS